MSHSDNRGLMEGLAGDGRPVISLVGAALIFSGAFAIFQSLTGQLLPHDTHALGMDARALAQAANPHVVHFMFHDRVAFGGTLLAIGAIYLWLAAFPLAESAAWAWWALAASGTTGFASFLAYLGYGYFDLWHGVATIFLLPLFAFGLWISRNKIPGGLHWTQIWRSVPAFESQVGKFGRYLIGFCGFGLVLAGIVICIVGMTFVFVPQDLRFMGLSVERLRAISPMLIPIIAHDRAGFGGGLLSCGVLVVFIVRHARLTRSVVQLLSFVGLTGFGAALGVHFAVGYLEFSHLAPAYAGASLFLIGDLLCALELKHRHQIALTEAASTSASPGAVGENLS
jgi:hypothetical protein